MPTILPFSAGLLGLTFLLVSRAPALAAPPEVPNLIVVSGEALRWQFVSPSVRVATHGLDGEANWPYTNRNAVEYRATPNNMNEYGEPKSDGVADDDGIPDASRSGTFEPDRAPRTTYARFLPNGVPIRAGGGSQSVQPPGEWLTIALPVPRDNLPTESIALNFEKISVAYPRGYRPRTGRPGDLPWDPSHAYDPNKGRSVQEGRCRRPCP